jgi:hypothetical protein
MNEISVCSIRSLTPTGYNKTTWTETCPNVSPSIIVYTDISPAPNPRLCIERPVKSCLKHGTAERDGKSALDVFACRNTIHVFLHLFNTEGSL